MFKKKNNKSAVNEAGIQVNWNTRYEIAYIAPPREMRLFVEDFLDADKKWKYMVDCTTVLWLPPFEEDRIEKSQVVQIVSNVREAMKCLYPDIEFQFKTNLEEISGG